jgi:hypothetical protein
MSEAETRVVELPEDRESEYTWNVSQTVSANVSRSDPEIETRTIQEDGVITRIDVVGDSSAQNLVAFRFGMVDSNGDMKRPWIPRDPANLAEYVPIDDHPVDPNLNQPVRAGDEVAIQYVSDSSNEHFVKALLFITEGGC